MRDGCAEDILSSSAGSPLVCRRGDLFLDGDDAAPGIREKDGGQYNEPGETGYATGCCVLVSREIIARVGTMDEGYFMYTEDADWSMRVRRAGYRVLYEPNAFLWHKLSVSAGGHLSGFKLKNKMLSNYRFFARYARWYHCSRFPGSASS